MTYNGSGAFIPDNNPSGVTSAILVSDTFNIADIRVRVQRLRHTFCGDVKLVLEKLEGPSATLVARIGVVGAQTMGDDSNFATDYTFDSNGGANIWTVAAGLGPNGNIPAGTYQTSGEEDGGNNNFSLDAFLGKSISGTWQLRAIDGFSGVPGDFLSWSLIVLPGAVCEPCGDANCDGFVTVADIGAFVTALTQGQTAWEAIVGAGACDYLCSNDTNNDGFVTVADIGTFVGALTGTPCQN